MIQIHPYSTVVQSMIQLMDRGVQSKQMQIKLGLVQIGIGARNLKIVKHIYSFNDIIMFENILIKISILKSILKVPSFLRIALEMLPIILRHLV